ncbi:dnaJ homolog subfamily C member 10-like isoform X1 [Hylaeus volcanicus]|uniref:dnaJ homolog subfamily C member 10-like isoform X1 n=2 Tax=Hylaeus volcanicus TaxID=313075 RepID=UPI0023B87557|nr:dnaJ homolog subfamily C member 10-like isoform X1 [Hylaeus volcanicus]
MYKSTIINVFLVIVDLSLSIGSDYYGILGVSRTADQGEIRRAFKKLALIEHPDKNNDNPDAQAKFIQLTKAYETLKDPVLRQRYDTYGEKGIETANKQGTYHSWSYYANNFGIYDDDPWIINLYENDYFENVLHAEKVWIVNFYSPMCSHCHKLAPAWKRIAEELDGAVRVGVVNCEDEWQLCRQIGIRSYPTLMHYPKNSKDGVQYNGERTYTAIMDFILDKLEINIQEIKEPLENFISRGSEGSSKPVLIFVCGGDRDCFTSTERFKVAAIFENTVDVKIFFCDHERTCAKSISDDTNVVYLSVSSPVNNSWQVVPFENVEETKVLIEKVMERLPEPCDLNAVEFENIKKSLTEEETSNSGWLVYFYIGYIAESDPVLKKLPSISDAVKLGKINCGKYSHICNTLGVNRYPMWGILKPGGAFELYHGKNTFNDIVKFVYSSVKAINVWALTAEQVTSILEGNNVNEAWFLDWYAPWCPPCVNFLREVRKASLEFDRSIVRFGTVDCTVHSTICHRYNIRSYPTAMLINDTDLDKFSMQKTAANIIQFINQARNPTVLRLTSKNFENQLGRRKGKFIWVVDYFSPRCAPCQRFTPEWIAVANTLSVLRFIKIASVDCEAEYSLCQSQRIHGYPTIRLYSSENQDLTKFDSYSGQWDSISVLRWIVRYFPRKVRQLDPSTLQREALTDHNVWVVDFFVPWCHHCLKLEPQFAIAAQLLTKTTIQFGRYNCEAYVTECIKAGVKQYPTLIAYSSQYNGKKITDGFHINETMAESIKRRILHFTTRMNHDEL